MGLRKNGPGYNGKSVFAIMAFFKEVFYLNRNSVADSAMLFVSVVSTVSVLAIQTRKPSRLSLVTFKLDILLFHIFFFKIQFPTIKLISALRSLISLSNRFLSIPIYFFLFNRKCVASMETWL